MPNKKRSMHHAIANAQKRTKRNKQKYYNRHILPGVLARAEEKKRKRALSDRLKKDLKKIEIISKKGRKVVKKTGVAVKKGGKAQKKEG